MKIKIMPLAILAAISICSSALADVAAAPIAPATGSSTDITIMGPEVPFPLSAVLPFPWGTIQGTWEAREKGFNALFSFEVKQAEETGPRRSTDNWKILRVLHLDPVTRKVLARGTGVATGDKRSVTAAMVSEHGTYMIYVAAYKNKDKDGTGPKTDTVLTVAPFPSRDETSIQVIMRKLDNTPVVEETGKMKDPRK